MLPGTNVFNMKCYWAVGLGKQTIFAADTPPGGVPYASAIASGMDTRILKRGQILKKPQMLRLEGT